MGGEQMENSQTKCREVEGGRRFQVYGQMIRLVK